MEPLRLSITNAVIGCSDVERTATFFARLGLTEIDTERVSGEVAATLYGLQQPVESLRVSAPGSRVGWLRLVPAEGRAPRWQPYRGGRTLLEFFAGSLEEATALALDAGAAVGGTTQKFGQGERRNTETRVLGPDEVEIGFTQSTKPRPSLLDKGRLLSELTTILRLVPSVAEALAAYPEFAVWSEFRPRNGSPPSTSSASPAALPRSAPCIWAIRTRRSNGCSCWS